MGWKGTQYLTREEAIELILAHVHNASNEELGNAVEGIGYGDNTELKHYGRNFMVFDVLPEEDNY